MFRLIEEFTFTVKIEDKDIEYTGTLKFEAPVFNNYGTMYTVEEIDKFVPMLNSLPMPEIYTLEILAQHLYISSVRIFKNLKAVCLWKTDEPHRKAEYIAEDISEFLKEFQGQVQEVTEIEEEQ